MAATVLLAWPLNGPASAAPPRLNATAWVLVDGRSGETLAGHQSATPRSIASATKLMTAYLALRELPLRKRVRMAPYSALAVESVLGVPAGTPINVRDLVYSLILESANDSAHTLAVAVAGSEPRFVAQMNRTAAALGLADTRFGNPIGLDEPGNYSSARDLATLTRRLLANRTFARIADSSTALLRSLRPPLRISSRNTLLLRAPWITGVKTGHTLNAGYVEVGSGRRKGVELVSVVLGAPSEAERDAESLALLDFGFSLYRVRRPVRPGEVIATPSIRYAGGELALRAAHPVTVGVRAGQSLQTSVRAPDEVEGPISRGRRLGRLTVLLEGRVAGATALLAARSIPEASAFEKLRSRAWAVVALLALVAFAILLIGLVVRRRRLGRVPNEAEMQRGREERRRIREQGRGSSQRQPGDRGARR